MVVGALSGLQVYIMCDVDAGNPVMWSYTCTARTCFTSLRKGRTCRLIILTTCRMTTIVLASVAVALATLVAKPTAVGEAVPPQEAGGRELLQSLGVCTDIEYLCGCDDFFELDVHAALSTPGNCTFDPGTQSQPPLLSSPMLCAPSSFVVRHIGHVDYFRF